LPHEGDICNCGDCPEDPTLACSYTGDDISVLANYVANAYRGNLLLCPGGDNGEIGGLLHQLDPAQNYSHMGIFVANHDLIRNCTASPGRLTAEEYYTGSVLGVKAPLDGLNVDHLQFGWPGTVTQSVEQALYADRYAAAGLNPPGTNQPYHGSDLTDLDSTENPQKRYRIGALSFDNVDGFDALVVKPCPQLESPLITEALNKIADAALQIYAHYRFYSYTDGAVAQDPNREGPATKVVAAMPAWDSAIGKWADWSDPNAVSWIDVPYTLPGVCSSYVWQAVQNVKKAHGPQIVLDWAEDHASALGEAGGKCRRWFPPDWRGDALDPYTLDGLYFYDESMREKAADWLYNALNDKVFNSLKDNLRDGGGVGAAIAGAIDIVGRGAFIAAATGGAAAVVALLATYAAGLSLVLADQLIELLYDMPQDIANQVVNSFAFDCHRGFPGDTYCIDAKGNQIRDVDSSNWSDATGPGRAVSPDNIAMFWDAPDGDPTRELIRGVYGYNVAVQVISAVVRKPVCKLVESSGTATIRGVVTYDGAILNGAHVEAACQHTVTQIEGDYKLVVRSDARYKLIARFEFPDRTLYGEADTRDPVAAGSVTMVNIAVTDPPECNRKISVTGTIRCDDVYLTGVDHAQVDYIRELQVQWGVAQFDTNTGQWNIDPGDPEAAKKHTDHIAIGEGVGDAQARLVIEARANSDLSVEVTVTGTLANLSTARTVNVADGASVGIAEFSHDTGGPFNDRAYFRNIQITNTPNNAI
jgi:hypothetical protein